MKNSFFHYEMNRIMKLRFTRITMVMVSFFPLVAAILFPYISQEIIRSILGVKSSTLLSQIIVFPAKAGAVFATLIFIALTVFEFDKILRFRVNYIIEPISSSIKINITKIAGLIWAGAISTVASIIIMLPYYICKIGSLKNFAYLLICYTLIIWGSIVFSVLMTAGFYLIFRKVNITCIIMLLAILFCFLAGNINYQYMWITTGASGLSENFGASNNILGIIWNRVFGLTVTISIFLVGMMCDRCYGKGVFKSLLKNCKRYKMLLICFLISFSGVFLVFKNEPIFKSVTPFELLSTFINGDKDTPINTDVKGDSDISIDFKIEKDKNYASGNYVQDLKNTTDKSQNIYFDLADGYYINEVKLDNNDINYTQVSSNSLNSAKIKNVFKLSIPENTKAKLSIRYSGTPKPVSVNGDFSTGISKKYVSLRKAWDVAPVVRVEQNDRSVVGKIKIDSKFKVITPGDKNKEISKNDDFTEWSFSYNNPNELCLTAGEYGIFQRDVSGTNIEFLYPVAAQKEFESRGNDILDIFTFFSEKFGSLRRDSIKIVITSGSYGGTGWQSGNISYVSEDCLTKKHKKNSYQASSSDDFALLTHEISHLWWGTGIDASNENSDNQIDMNHNEWSNEAFADFSTYLFLKEKFGEDYTENLLLKKWQEQVDELNRNFYRRNPDYMDKLSMIPQYKVVLSLNNNITYGLGPLTIYKMYNYIGEENYYNSMKIIYKEYYDKKDKKLSFTDFLNITGINKEEAFNE